MATTRIKDLTATSSIADDDYVVMDGATYGTRRIAASEMGRETIYSVSSTGTSSWIDSRGVSSGLIQLFPTSSADVTIENLGKVRLYAKSEGSSDTTYYPLEMVKVTISNTVHTYFLINFKSHYGSPQDTSTNYLPEVYIIATAPFELASISVGM